MRRLVIAAVIVVGAFALYAGTASADGGPHGNYSALTDGTTGLTDACAGCHRVHQGVADNLLKAPTVYEVCVSCHDGEGSKLDVVDGVKLAATLSGPIPGQTGTTLNGGGFDYVNGVQATSRHNLQTSTSDPGQTQPWGFGADTGTKNWALDTPLTCTSCHNPHGSPNYRILNENISTANGGASVVYSGTVSVLAYYNSAFTKDEGAPGLQSGVPTDKYTADYYGSAGLSGTGGYDPDGSLTSTPGNTGVNGFALLCGRCHSTYPSATGMDQVPATNPWGITKYRHRTEMPYTDWSNPMTGATPQNPETGTFGASWTPPLPRLRLASNPTDGQYQIVTCLTCHRAHGTSSQMSGFALSKALGGSSPDAISPAQGVPDIGAAAGKSNSMLLFTDNRGMCEACHQWAN